LHPSSGSRVGREYLKPPPLPALGGDPPLEPPRLPPPLDPLLLRLLERERDRLGDLDPALLGERERPRGERDPPFLGDRDRRLGDRERPLGDFDSPLLGERERLLGDRDRLLGERDDLLLERDLDFLGERVLDLFLGEPDREPLRERDLECLLGDRDLEFFFGDRDVFLGSSITASSGWLAGLFSLSSCIASSVSGRFSSSGWAFGWAATSSGMVGAGAASSMVDMMAIEG